jgi:hypothetical protein
VSVPSSELAPLPALPQASVSPPLKLQGGGQHSLAGEGGEGGEGANWNDRRENLALCLLSGVSAKQQTWPTYNFPKG